MITLATETATEKKTAYTAYVVRPSRSKANDYGSGHLSTQERAVAMCLAKMNAGGTRGCKEIVLTEWYEEHGSWLTNIFGGSRRLTIDEAYAFAGWEVPAKKEPVNELKTQGRTALNKLRAGGWIGSQQGSIVSRCLGGEEWQFFAEKMIELWGVVEAMPKVYEQDGKGDEAIVYLHYFRGAGDWHITEKDTSVEQHQAFGMANLGFGWEGSLGYISIVELTGNNVELDFHWTPKTLREVKAKK